MQQGSGQGTTDTPRQQAGTTGPDGLEETVKAVLKFGAESASKLLDERLKAKKTNTER